MGERVLVFLHLLFSYLFVVVVTKTSNEDYLALLTLKYEWKNTPPSWEGSEDPCGDHWEGIECINSRVTTISLASMDLSGQLSADIGLLSELQILVLSYNKNLTGPLHAEIGNLKKLTNLQLINCGFIGPIPDTIGNLQRLVFLSLNSNRFSGKIPPAIGNLSSIYWLDLAENQLEGRIPISNGTTPGLDMLHKTKHFHFGRNKLSGNIPPQLFSSQMSLIHVLFESNQFTGSIPSTLGLVQHLEVVRLDHNFLGGPLPKNINNLTKVRELFLSNNRITGPLPDLTGMNVLSYLMMENIQLQGLIPVSLFSLEQLQTVMLKNNQLNGTLDIGTSISDQLGVLDLQTNFIENFDPQIDVSKVEIILVENPVCQDAGVVKTYCSITKTNDSYTTPTNNCVPITCTSNQILSPKCKCAYPYTGTLTLRAPSFSDLGNKTVFAMLEYTLMESFRNHDKPVDSVSLSNPRKNVYQYLDLNLEIFPSDQVSFDRTAISGIGFILSNQTYKPPPIFGPFYFIADKYEHYLNDSVIAGHVPSSKSSNIGIIAGAAIGGSVMLVLLLLAVVYGFRQKNKARRAKKKSNLFEQWGPDESNSSIPQLKGARRFSFDEIQNYTKKFAQVNYVGAGGYGKVYRGTLPNGQLIAVKRAQKESIQGGLEFKTEIELLSRVHHKNLVSLIGFCFEQGEQILVYEYVVNGTLTDALLGKSGIRLDWIRRLKIALGAARGLDYLHELANPPIIHRDVKSTNILLDERLNAKVSDFGLSKPLGDGAKGYITTQVKGTMGYLDPEYYMTQQLTEKSDVYSFGVLMLELVTARRPIERGKYIVKVVKNAIDKTKELYGLTEILDPVIDLRTSLNSFEKFMDLAMQCVEESSSNRPSMNYALKEIENMLLLAGSNPNAESAPTSSSYNASGNSMHPYDNEYFDSSVVLPRA
ncbi:leucine-rich repeat receptor protein kinase HPCA1-like isoform X3 [Cicer arietinum]|uniref:non-specific serine/threonine protein kinase n=1 Tax=Cicer arietinum TaxID=3827 RepID=A0A3Q7WZL0_CICAR|nr:probable leucine-rich repeat receptor-like protein kinase At5g49770 isoform X2 [Cicer arietinum]